MTEETLTSFLKLLFTASWQAGLLAIFIFILQKSFKKLLSPSMVHALWWVVLLRLIILIPPPSPFSFFTPIEKTGQYLYQSIQSPNSEPAQKSQNKQPYSVIPIQEKSNYSLWVYLITSIWFSGFLILLFLILRANWKMSRTVSKEKMLIDPNSLETLEACREIMNVDTPVFLAETSLTRSPALMGFLRPRLILPLGLSQKFNSNELKYIFLHEFGHLKRSDIAQHWILSFLVCVHWFNPLIWWASYKFRQDREPACDALALKHLNSKERLEYGKTILKLWESYASPGVLPGLAGILEGGDPPEERISLIARPRKGFALFFWILFLVLCLGFLSSAQKLTPTFDLPTKLPSLTIPKKRVELGRSNTYSVNIIQYDPDGPFQRYAISTQDRQSLDQRSTQLLSEVQLQKAPKGEGLLLQFIHHDPLPLAHSFGLRDQDIITHLNLQPVSSLQDLLTQWEHFKPDARRIILQVKRGKQIFLVSFEMDDYSHIQP